MEESFEDRGFKITVRSNLIASGKVKCDYAVEPISEAAKKAFGGAYNAVAGVHSEEITPRDGTPFTEADGLEHAKSGAKAEVDRSVRNEDTHRQIIDEALAGTSGDLHFQFRSADQGDRMVQINETINRYGLEGLTVKVLLNPEDGKGQPLPFELHGHFRTCGSSAEVPAGWFVLRIAMAAAL